MKYLAHYQQIDYVNKFLNKNKIKYKTDKNFYTFKNSDICLFIPEMIQLIDPVKNLPKDKETITMLPWHDIKKIIEMLSYRLNINKTETIYARKTKVKIEKIDKKHRDFINDNHILDCPPFRNKIAAVSLLYNNEIIGIGVFTKINDDTAELKRLVFKQGYNVPGGSSKIIKNFQKEYNYKNILTFSDKDLGEGNVYKTLGFELIEDSKPQITWFNPEFNKKFSNISLIMVGADRLLNWYPGYTPFGIGENLPTNQEIVQLYGFLPIYDNGYKKWVKRYED